jgi:hypothetical protein
LRGMGEERGRGDGVKERKGGKGRGRKGIGDIVPSDLPTPSTQGNHLHRRRPSLRMRSSPSVQCLSKLAYLPTSHRYIRPKRTKADISLLAIGNTVCVGEEGGTYLQSCTSHLQGRVCCPTQDARQGRRRGALFHFGTG